ncbi:MAG: hypothetical protein JO190_06480 [Candidatus Eremiobacteraeota bacterium]|nr:hypothetical protein [Candidatus Eremiobacteraeota bacterium]MBV8499116.1 hypothetical protein [Candidatus Eremiobacteraeota bacterium]
MPDEFVPLERFLRPAPPQPALLVIEPPSTPPVVSDLEETIRTARRFRAALADALDIAVARLLPKLAHDVLARELRLAPADVAAIAAAALERFAGEKTLALRAHPADVDALASVRIAVVSDTTLRPGDVVLELHSGTIDLRMASRLDWILSACV